jgi:hypothetical protein
MAVFRCRSCGKEGTWVYDPERFTCPLCDSIDVQFIISRDEVPEGKIRKAHYEQRFRPHHAYARHLQSRAFLESEMRKPRSGPLVVVTHHAPMPSRAYRLGRHYPGSRPSDEEVLTAAYRSDLTSLMWPAPIADGKPALRPPDVWIFGHTHESEDTMIGSTRIVSNANGYGPWPSQQATWDNPRFDPNFVIEI